MRPEEWAKLGCETYPGDLVEIGLGIGETTRELFPVAKHFGRKLIGIDPFDDMMPATYKYSYEEFAKNNFDPEVFIHHRKSSLCKSSWDVCHTLLSFAFVDGLQYYGAVLNDLMMVSHACIICVDDYDRMSPESEVPEAIKLFLKWYKFDLKNEGRWAILTKSY